MLDTTFLRSAPTLLIPEIVGKLKDSASGSKTELLFPLQDAASVFGGLGFTFPQGLTA